LFKNSSTGLNQVTKNLAVPARILRIFYLQNTQAFGKKTAFLSNFVFFEQLYSHIGSVLRKQSKNPFFILVQIFSKFQSFIRNPFG
jgi:hypothetical protein